MNVHKGEANLDHYAVLGNPIAPSKLPFIHNFFAEQTSQRMVYSTILVPEFDLLLETLSEFHLHGGKGVNITAPFKQLAFSLVDTHSERAKQAQAINIIKWDNQGHRYSDNTDGTGFIRDIIRNKGLTLFAKRILILGAGGAALGILGPLLEEHPEEVVIINRTENNAKRRAKQYSAVGNIHACSVHEVSGKFDLIINTTMSNFSFFEQLSPKITHTKTFCYDLNYTDVDTSFLQWAREIGAKQYCNGWGMLVEQAAQSFFFWRGIMPNTKTLLTQKKISLTYV